LLRIHFSPFSWFGTERRSNTKMDEITFIFNTLEVSVMGMMQDFRAFAVKGNVIDLAVGVIIGAAFAKIVDSLVQDIIMPIVGRIFGGFDFTNYYLPLNGQSMDLTLAEAKKAGAVFAYGSFITILLNFVILAFIIFQMVRLLQRAKRNEPAPAEVPPPTAEEVLLLREIRDALKNQTGSGKTGL
jgi:large conductance mechanosensitive channel